MTKHVYLESVFLLERLHRMFLDVLKNELERQHISDLSNVQAIILYNIGDMEVTVSAVTSRGYYLGSNASYNLKKMQQNDYIEQRQSSVDRRSSHIKLSSKGDAVKQKLDAFFEKHTQALAVKQVGEKELESFLRNGKLIEGFWSEEMLKHMAKF